MTHTIDAFAHVSEAWDLYVLAYDDDPEPGDELATLGRSLDAQFALAQAVQYAQDSGVPWAGMCGPC